MYCMYIINLIPMVEPIPMVDPRPMVDHIHLATLYPWIHPYP